MKIMPTSMPKDIDKYFFNRVKDIEIIKSQLNLLEKDIPQQLLLTGYRGVGKTFLLRKLLKDLPENYLSIFIDLSEINARQKNKLTEELILKEILKSINNVINYDERFSISFEDKIKNKLKNLRLKNYNFSNSGNIFDIPIPIIKDNYEELSKFVMELPQNIVDSYEEINGFVIVIDEFQLLQNLKESDAFFWLIRSFTQKQFNVSYIFTGSVSRTSDIITMINGQQGAFGGRLIQINIDPFDIDETKRYIEEKSNNIQFTEKGFERFYNCTRGIPLYINSLSSILPNNMICDEKIIKETLYYNIDQVAIMWVYIWGRLTQGEKDFIIYLLEHNGATRKTLEQELNYSKSTIARYIDSLSNRGIIEYNNKKFTIADKMLATWLKIKNESKGSYPL